MENIADLTQGPARKLALQLGKSRQQSIDAFLSFGGKVGRCSQLELSLKTEKSYPSRTNFTKNARIVSHPLYMISLAHRTPTNKVHPISISQTINEICSDKLAPQLIVNSSVYSSSQSTKMGITVFSLDHQGALLAVGHKSGFLSVYDVDEIHLQTCNSSKQ
jgi:hypothetical protein